MRKRINKWFDANSYNVKFESPVNENGSKWICLMNNHRPYFSVTENDDTDIYVYLREW